MLETLFNELAGLRRTTALKTTPAQVCELINILKTPSTSVLKSNKENGAAYSAPYNLTHLFLEF